jgi:hypothetical protein
LQTPFSDTCRVSASFVPAVRLPTYPSMGQSVRSLAAEADLTVRECLHVLHRAGLRKVVGGQRLEGHELSRARQALGLPLQHKTVSDSVCRQMLDGEELLVRLLRPLRQKGKLGREHTTPIEHLYGHGVPDHQKAQARDLVEMLLTRGCLAEKVSQGRRHVWLTTTGLAHLARAERPLAA